MEDCLASVARALNECRQLSGREDLPEVDRLVLSLKLASVELGILLSGDVSQDDDDEDELERNLNQLHVCLNQLCLQYETKLLFLLPMNPAHRVSSLTHSGRGCPRKVINLPMVSECTAE